ncbi:alpha/beta fold hydrolase [Variovorax paradoxus]|nr:alpha/beta fold hydrolase [Variovorax paradoxus]MBT2305441.1 alpha/beta fold hydrolase [Variovorax paradoxus]
MALAAASSVAIPCLGADAASAARQRTFVLVHGAFHGGWCWAQVAELMRREGHRVFTPTFTGVGERAHLLNPNVELNTFIQDVVAVIAAEELSDVVLVAHSFGGCVATGVIDQVPARIASAVYLDATIGTNGQSILEGAPPNVRQERLNSAISVNGTRAIAPPTSSTAFGVSDPAQVAWVNRRMTPMPLKAYQSPLVLKGAPGGTVPKLYIRCTAPPLATVEASAQYAKEQGWRYEELATGHNAMVSMPAGLAKLLMQS